MSGWKKARKRPVVVEYREVMAPYETIITDEGELFAFSGRDYIIRGVRGEYYPIKKEIFSETYDILEADEQRATELHRDFMRRWVKKVENG